MESTTSGRGCKLKFLIAKRVQFILDFLDLFTKPTEKQLLLEKLLLRYQSEQAEKLAEIMRRMEENDKQTKNLRRSEIMIDEDFEKKRKELELSLANEVMMSDSSKNRLILKLLNLLEEEINQE